MSVTKTEYYIRTAADKNGRYRLRYHGNVQHYPHYDDYAWHSGYLTFVGVETVLIRDNWRIANAEAAMGRYYGIPDPSYAARWAVIDGTNHQIIGIDTTIYDQNRVIGTVRGRYFPPLHLAMRSVEKHFFQQDIPVKEVLLATIREARQTRETLRWVLSKLGQNTPARAVEYRQQREKYICHAGDCYGDDEHLTNMMLLWDAVHAKLRAEEDANIAAGQLEHLDWLTALQQAEVETGISRPTVHPDHRPPSDASLSGLEVMWNVVSPEGPMTRILVSHDTPGLHVVPNIPAEVTEVIVTANTTNARAAIYHGEHELMRGPLTVTMPTGENVTLRLEVVAADQLTVEKHEILLERATE